MKKYVWKSVVFTLLLGLLFVLGSCDLFTSAEDEGNDDADDDMVVTSLFGDSSFTYYLKDTDTPEGDELSMSTAWENSADISVDASVGGTAEFTAYPSWWGGGTAWAQIPDSAIGTYDLSGVAEISFDIKSDSISTDELGYMVQWLSDTNGEGGEFAVSLLDLGVSDINSWNTVTVDMTLDGDISDDVSETGRYGKTPISFFTGGGNQYVDTAFALKWMGDAGTESNSGPLEAGDSYQIRNIQFLDGSGNHAVITDGVSYPVGPSAGDSAPTVDSTEVISFYTSANTYTNTTVDEWNPDWGQAGALTDFDTGSGTVKELDLQNYQGIDFADNPIDITGKTTLHISYYTDSVTGFDFYPIWDGGEAPVASGALNTDSSWHDLELDLSAASGIDLTTIKQFKFDIASNTVGVIYLDNIYLH